MNPSNVNTDIVTKYIQNQGSDDQVIYKREQSQTFSAEDFATVYNDSIQNLKNIMNKIEDTEEDIQDTLEEKQEAMQQIHALCESEPQNKAQLEADSVTVDDYNAFMQLQQKKQQVEQQRNQEANLRNQLHQMKEAAEQASETSGVELEEIPEKRGEEKGVEINT